MENNTPKTQETQTEDLEQKREKPWYIVSIISAVLYSAFIFIGLDYTGSKTLAGILIACEVVYVISLVLIIVLSKDKSKLSLRIKNYKSAVKILKAFSSIICLILAISVVISSASGFDMNNFFDICYKIFMIAFSALSAIFSISTIIFRKKIENTKALLKEKLKENWEDSKIKR